MTTVYVSGGSGRERFHFKGTAYTKSELKKALKTRGITVYYSGSKPSLKAQQRLDYIIGPGGHLSASSQKVADRHPEATVLSWEGFMKRVLLNGGTNGVNGVGGGAGDKKKKTTPIPTPINNRTKKAGSSMDLLSLLSRYEDSSVLSTTKESQQDMQVTPQHLSSSKPRRATSNTVRRGMEIFWDSHTALSFLTH